MRIKLWNRMSFRIRRSTGNKRWMTSIGKNGFNRQHWSNSLLIASIVVWAWLIDRTWHIHWFKPIGDWTGYVGIKRCRCGEEREYDIY